MLKPSLQLKLGQTLTMTPQLQQAIRLLQLPALELQAHIRELLESERGVRANGSPSEIQFAACRGRSLPDVLPLSKTRTIGGAEAPTPTPRRGMIRFT